MLLPGWETGNNPNPRGGCTSLLAPLAGLLGQLGELRWTPSLCPGMAVALMVFLELCVPSDTEMARVSPPQPMALSSNPPHGPAAPRHTGGSLLELTSYSLKSDGSEKYPLTKAMPATGFLSLSSHLHTQLVPAQPSHRRKTLYALQHL